MMDLTRLHRAQSRAITPENRTGGPGMGARTPQAEGTAAAAARELGDGWKVNPYLIVDAGETMELADIRGSGAITHMWITVSAEARWRNLILRMYWDDQEAPSVECPLGDFFCMGWQQFMQINSLAVCVNPGSGLNCYWEMPFARHARVTLENRNDARINVYYQIDYQLRALEGEPAYFHAQFRRVNPVPYGDVVTVLDGAEGRGHYVGTYLAWGVHNSGWWGEGEFKFYVDGDTDYPTICGTGTEDYFCGSYDFKDPVSQDHYLPFSTPYTGLQVLEPNRLYRSQFRFGMYRWHLPDPIFFERRLRVTVQALGWREGGRYLPLQDDIASVAYWYQSLPTAPFPPLGDKNALEVI